MKSVLISIQPKWVEKICSGEKTIEVRKTRPKSETPFKCYIYATKPKKWFRFSRWGSASDESLWLLNGKVKMCDGLELWAEDCEYEHLSGKVIGEFVCDYIDEIHEWELFPCKMFYIEEKARLDLLLKRSCLSYGAICDYRKNLPSIKPLYGWRITKLKIYDKPKELGEFKPICNKVKYYETESKEFYNHCLNCEHLTEIDSGLDYFECGKFITRPPQSWCYVEDNTNER